MKTKKRAAKPKRRPKLKLGATYKDQITGFEGVASGIVKYMTGCDQVLLAPQARDGVKLDAHWFDKPRVIRMPGKIIKVHVSPGQSVLRGAPLIVLEAMKMEHSISAPADGKIAQVHYVAGDLVEEGAELIAFEAEDAIP